MTFQEIGLVILVSISALNAWASVQVAIDSPEYLLSQKVYKIVIIWLIPIFGVLMILMFRKSDRAELPPLDETREKADLADINERGML